MLELVPLVFAEAEAGDPVADGLVARQVAGLDGGRLTQLTAPPVVGAALLGLDRLGAPPGAAERLRATLTHERPGALRPVAAST